MGLVTDQDKAFRPEVSQVLEGGDHVLAVLAALEMAFVDLARHSQAVQASWQKQAFDSRGISTTVAAYLNPKEPIACQTI